jgi:hypothetical protein
MLNTPPEILKDFLAVLENRAVPPDRHNDYRKRLRYYLDYCGKYNLPDGSSQSLIRFLGKLREKKQTEGQVKQAGHAVSLYLDLIRSRRGGPPRGAPARRGGAGKPDEIPAKSSSPPALASASRAESPDSPTETSPWDEAVSDLVTIIKTKHYSPKTLRSYRHWVLRFRGCRRNADTLALGSEDVKGPAEGRRRGRY